MEQIQGRHQAQIIWKQRNWILKTGKWVKDFIFHMKVLNLHLIDLYENSDVILFFNASWFSTCKVARENFEASLDQIPADLTIVVVDFDNSDDIRKLYGVTLQRTFVQIDSNGDALKKWSGSTTISDLVKQIV